VLTALLEPHDEVRWVGNTVFAATAVALLALIAVLMARAGRAWTPSAAPPA
jgi:hypothetical protein